MTIELVQIPLPEISDSSKFTKFGREVKGFDPANLAPEQFAELQEALYKVNTPPIPPKVLI